MSRTTDTRQRVRELADRIAAEGGAPSSRLIRQVLGKGSPNTIHDELSKWHQARVAPTVAASSASSGPEDCAAPAPALPADEAFAKAQQQNALLLQRIEALFEQSGAVPAQLEELVSQLHSLSTRVEDDRRWMERELNSANARFEGVQRHMLMQVDEARHEAIRWKELHQKVKAEFGTWQETMRQKNQRLVDEVNWLRGKSGMPMAVDAPTEPVRPVRPAASLSTPRALGYPGHPRVVVQASDD